MQRLSSSFLLFVVTVIAILVSADSDLEHCHDGFMELQSRSAQINDNNQLGIDTVHLLNEGTNFKRYTMHSLGFSCAGTITGFLLGVDVRHDGDKYDKFPQIILHDGNFSKFTHIPQSSRRAIELDFQSKCNGLYKMKLKIPLTFTGGQFIGVNQPGSDKSAVQFYRQTLLNQVIDLVNDKFKVLENIPNSRILLHPIADNYSCIHGFISENEIFKMAALIGSFHQEPNYIGKNVFFKQIRFLCSNVIIKSIIIGGTINSSHTEMPRILIWRNSVNFSGVISTTLNNSFIHQNTSIMNLYQYDLPVPISVQADDIIGIYQPNITQAGAVIYYQKYSGPENYFLNDSMLLQSAEKNHYPLISIVIESNVEIEPTLESISTLSPSVKLLAVSSMMYMYGSESDTFTSQTMSGVTIFTINSNFDVTSLDTHNVTTSRNVIVAITVPVMLIVVAMIIGIPLVVLLKQKLSFKKDRKDVVNELYQGLSIMANSVYGDTARGTHNELYEPVTNTYSQVGGQLCVEDSQCEPPPPQYTAVNDLYEMIDSHDSVKDDMKEQREKLNLNQKLECDGLDEDGVDAIYAMTHNVSAEDLAHIKNSAYGELTTQFTCVDTCFTEDPIYWEPELINTERIYEQVAEKKNPHKELNVVKNIAPGQFGKVAKGKWTFKKEIDVAIKTLKSSATEEDEVKLLQEAAINGQFHHPNIVTLLGVVTIGKPTMIVLEFMCNGDLKHFLEAKQPLPGELPHQSSQSMLYEFSIQVAKGMKYLSGKKFVHRDLAARNILVGDNNICKIADFGMSRDLQDETYYVSNANRIPVKWRAPEALHYKQYSCQSDIWSFGALLYELWSVGHKPFGQNTNTKCIELSFAPSSCLSKRIYKIMLTCWHPEASKRPTFALLEEQLIGFKTELPSEVMIGLGGPLDMELSLFPDL